MTQSIVVQVGQCGNQIGSRFWELALKEHTQVNKKGIFDEALSSFFRNVDTRRDLEIPVGEGTSRIRSLKSRSVLVDMEEGVVSELLNGPLKDVFDHRQLVTDVSGSGNNWAVGYHDYGPRYRSDLVDAVRRAAEQCDCLQCFFLLHSMGGGTGSGLGTYILSMLHEEFPDVYRFVCPVYPSEDDDVITSPYNSVLAMGQLTEHADCVMPVENQALMDIVNKITSSLPPDRSGKRVYDVNGKPAASLCAQGDVSKEEKPFDRMNNIVANLLLNVTSSSRFEGSLNVDLNEITMNLVPFPRLHYLCASQAPLYCSTGIKIPPRRLDQMFSDAFSRQCQLLRVEPKRGTYLACALMARGSVHVSELRKNIERLRPTLQFVPWNEEGWKVGLCSVAPAGHPYSLLSLANNTAICSTFNELHSRFNKLFRRKAHLHHYTRVQGADLDEFSAASESLVQLSAEYTHLSQQQLVDVPRLKPAS